MCALGLVKLVFAARTKAASDKRVTTTTHYRRPLNGLRDCPLGSALRFVRGTAGRLPARKCASYAYVHCGNKPDILVFGPFSGKGSTRARSEDKTKGCPARTIEVSRVRAKVCRE